MTENMKAFQDAFENNEGLKKKFDEISNKEETEQKDYTDEYIALAKECGITLTKDDFELDEEELSDEDLENVSGGSKKGWKKFMSIFAHPDYPDSSSSQQGSETTGDQN